MRNLKNWRFWKKTSVFATIKYFDNIIIDLMLGTKEKKISKWWLFVNNNNNTNMIIIMIIWMYHQFSIFYLKHESILDWSTAFEIFKKPSVKKILNSSSDILLDEQEDEDEDEVEEEVAVIFPTISSVFL